MAEKLNKKPVNGMKDVLPREMQIRQYCMSVIRENYKSYGFTEIETPAMESIGNLCSKQGGENEKLIFKVLKRGEKLQIDTAQEENDLADSGLRYDLTLPLSRYYANHASELPSPFKALQMGNVWRAERPQKGRFRQFMQCDIDILGEPTNLAEIELILATSSTLKKLGFANFKVRINDRRMLRAMSDWAGFGEEQFESVCIILDKMDKIGADGVKSELLENGFSAEAVEKYTAFLQGMDAAEDVLGYVKETLGDALGEDVSDNLSQIMTSVMAAGQNGYDIAFDPTLVRGMGYYTGTIFEIEMADFGSSVAGGGRYDKMVGRFTGNDTPACGFSIGFERIITILLEQDFQIPGEKEKVAFLLEKNLPAQKLADAIAKAQARRDEGQQVVMVRMNKNKKFQKQQLTEEGYTEFVEFYCEELRR
ncbi:MAG: histidine--tRNA ligase [Lachnospiraceae bacterium]|nr:histidine--tRNA ligase [Lachnospiraceae bacterium]